MAEYWSDIGNGATIFTGYTAATGSGCSTKVAGTAIRTTATPFAPHRFVMKPATNAFCNSSVKAKLTINTSNNWYKGWSYAKPTAYTQAMKVNAVSVQANFKKAKQNKFWIAAYNSAGTLQSRVVVGTNTAGTITSNFALNTTPFVTVPAGGYLVFQVGLSPSTNKGSGKGEIKWGQTAKTPGVRIVTNEVPAITGPQATITAQGAGGTASIVADVQLITVTHTFQSDAGVPLADGINVVAFEASTMGNANPTVCGNAAIAGGAGSVTIVCLNANPVVLVPDHAHPSFPAGEVGHSPPITPTVV